LQIGRGGTGERKKEKGKRKKEKGRGVGRDRTSASRCTAGDIPVVGAPRTGGVLPAIGGGGERENSPADGQASGLPASLAASSKPQARSLAGPNHQLALVLLAGIIIAALAGINLAGLLDPLSLLTRGLGALGVPTAQDANRWLASGEHDGSPLLREWIAPEGQPWGSGLLAVQAVPALMLLAVPGLTLFGSRLWCRRVCPLGALYGLLGRVALCRRAVNNRCVLCGACARACPMHALASGGSTAFPALCTSCRSCQAACPAEAISFSPAKAAGYGLQVAGAPHQRLHSKPEARSLSPAASPFSPSPPAFNRSRRSFIRALVAGGAVLPLIPLLRDASANPADADPLPPNVTDADRFAASCLRCGACVRICPSKTLQLAGSSPGLLGLWLPRRDTSRPCYFPDCHECGRVCPAGAIPYNGVRYHEDEWEAAPLSEGVRSQESGDNCDQRFS